MLPRVSRIAFALVPAGGSVRLAVAYRYRIKVEDEMLVAALGPPYAEYRGQVRALLPFPRVIPSVSEGPGREGGT